MDIAAYPYQDSIADWICHAEHLVRGYFAATILSLADNAYLAGDIS
jgi:hypothetical protein